jgi:hypothetical protein
LNQRPGSARAPGRTYAFADFGRSGLACRRRIGHRVDPSAAVERVIAVAAIEQILAAEAAQPVVTAEPTDLFCDRRAGQDVVAIITDDGTRVAVQHGFGRDRPIREHECLHIAYAIGAVGRALAQVTDDDRRDLTAVQRRDEAGTSAYGRARWCSTLRCSTPSDSAIMRGQRETASPCIGVYNRPFRLRLVRRSFGHGRATHSEQPHRTRYEHSPRWDRARR